MLRDLPIRSFAILVAALAAAVPTGPALAGSKAPAQLGRAFERDRLAGLAVGAPIVVEDVELGLSAPVTLRLERFSVTRDDARFVVGGRDPDAGVLRPDVVLLRGTVNRDDESLVFVGVSRAGVHGFVRRAGDMHFLSSGPYAPGADDRGVFVTDAASLPAGLDFCQVRDEHVIVRSIERGRPSDGPPPCREVEIAVETDWPFTGALFAGDTVASAGYALTLAAATSEIYRRDFNTALNVTFVRVWEADVDPYDAETSGDTLGQVRSWWTTQETDVERDLVHLYSGANLGGGVAWVGVICSTQWGYAVSGNLGGTFPYPLTDNHPQNWDPYVVAHETGHNFGTLHTHDGYEPPIDGCGLGDCTDADQGTIMSYCHGCAGGMANINLHFHPRVIDLVLGYLDGVPCDIAAAGPVAAHDFAATWELNPITVDVLLNDERESCDGAVVALQGFDAVSNSGGTVELVPAGGGEPRDRLRYTPASGYDGRDTFTYSLVGGPTAVVNVDVAALRDPVATGPVGPGATVAYYVLPGSVLEMPDFDMLVPYGTDVTADLDFAEQSGPFATSGRAQLVGAVFEGFVTVPTGGLYRFYLDSTDGSILYIGDDVVVDNDGSHQMQERGDFIHLHAGAHPVRVEYFNKFSTNGLIVSFEGPGVGKQPIPASAWSHPAACPGDVDGGGTVAFADLLAILKAWGPCPACPEDINGDGAVTFADLLIVLGAWGPCP